MQHTPLSRFLPRARKVFFRRRPLTPEEEQSILYAELGDLAQSLMQSVRPRRQPVSERLATGLGAFWRRLRPARAAPRPSAALHE